MSKKSRLTEEDSIFAKGVKAGSQISTAPEMPKQLTIREADGGYVVSSFDGSLGSNKDKVYTTVDELKECIEHKFGKGKKSLKEE